MADWKTNFKQLLQPLLPRQGGDAVGAADDCGLGWTAWTTWTWVMVMDGRNDQPTSIHVHVVHTSQETRRKPLHDSTRSKRLIFPGALAEESEQSEFQPIRPRPWGRRARPPALPEEGDALRGWKTHLP